MLQINISRYIAYFPHALLSADRAMYNFLRLTVG